MKCQGCNFVDDTLRKDNCRFWLCGCGTGNSHPDDITFSENQILIYLAPALKAAPERAMEFKKIALDNRAELPTRKFLCILNTMIDFAQGKSINNIDNQIQQEVIRYMK